MKRKYIYTFTEAEVENILVDHLRREGLAPAEQVSSDMDVDIRGASLGNIVIELEPNEEETPE